MLINTTLYRGKMKRKYHHDSFNISTDLNRHILLLIFNELDMQRYIPKSV